MFGMLQSLTKAAVGVVVTPVAAVADIVTFIPDAVDNKPIFNRTGQALNSIEENLKDAVDPAQKD